MYCIDVFKPWQTQALSGARDMKALLLTCAIVDDRHEAGLAIAKYTYIVSKLKFIQYRFNYHRRRTCCVLITFVDGQPGSVETTTIQCPLVDKLS